MPIYTYECQKCGDIFDYPNSIEERHSAAPYCDCSSVRRGKRAKLIISGCMAIVKFPAAGGHEYISPTSGKPITTHRARVDDLKRTHSRPYEGFEAEKKESERKVAYEEKKSDAKLEDATRRAYHSLSPKQRRALEAA